MYTNFHSYMRKMLSKRDARKETAKVTLKNMCALIHMYHTYIYMCVSKFYFLAEKVHSSPHSAE